MRIKRLEIVGFKSFCDRTVFHFNEPITGVVGPNGCGKSNVVDAIRWCMGEQSARHLRGKAMEDVIFAGSDRRGPLGYCEVSLTFENDGRVPIDYLQYSEITVGRRLFRDGTSEYFLNKTPCRLRDITEFFLGTGIGTRAYSIIEQGRVGLIVTSKPEDRRFLIEEAAGITKYKLKRKAAEKKMELAQQNLLRISDVIAEQDKQLATLRRQAEKAERYKRYRAELRDLELWNYSHRWLALLLEERVYAGLLGAAVEARDQAQAEILRHESQLSTTRLELAEQERQLAEQAEALHALDKAVRLGEAENEHARRERERLLAQAEQLAQELALLAEQSACSRADQERMAAQLAEVEASGAGHDGEIRACEEAQRQARQELNQVSRLADQAKAEIARHNAEIARHEAHERSTLRHQQDLALRLQRNAEEQRRLQQRQQELTQQVEEQQQRLQGLQAEKVNLVKARAALEERHKDLKLQISRLEREVDQLRGELHRRRARLQSLHEIAAKYEGFAQGTRALLTRAQRNEIAGIRGVVADVLLAPAELEVALEAVLGERLEALIVEEQRHAVAAIELLRKGGEGHASFVPLEARPTRPSDRPQLPDDQTQIKGVRGRIIDMVQAAPGYEAVLDALLGKVLLVDSLEHALAYFRVASEDGSLPPGGLVVTLDGTLCDGHGVLSGGQRSQGASVLAQKRELRELEALVSELAARLREQDEQLAVSRAELAHLGRQLEEMQRAGHQGEMQILALDKDLARSREELVRTTHRLQVLREEEAELVEQEKRLLREAEEARLEVRNARERLVQWEAERERHGQLQLHLMERVEELGHQLMQLKVQLAARREKIAAIQASLSRLEREERDRAAQVARLSREADAARARAAQIAVEIEQRTATLLEQVAARTRLAEEMQVQRAAYEERRGTLSEAESTLRERRGREAGLVREVSRLQMRLSELGTQRRHLEEAVLERHRVALSEVVHDYHLRPQFPEQAERRIVELRDLIERMGEINLMAIEECRELEKRHSFLLGQKQDLETALRQLQQAIAHINQTCRQRFREVFDLVNAKFQEIFPRCFLGGQARLVLTREDDLLESGIEIIAQPPGKKNQSVELLSGGEKAMTAVALIFAIFLIKPSPFCLLDEVDAPLDEANVGRFNDLIRDLTDRCQFILITHNKRTMQIADTLYGVTMEEPGVSKVVSVHLNDLGSLERRAARARAA
ncbi:MAG: chromosome segregation protein SMC [Myxococcales bacterium]|nr:chromosome segregation protein SMC [Myxococcota bacterium]MDW8281526.1 chromosome segregation protein SMC [Myxococcales bacterium]